MKNRLLLALITTLLCFAWLIPAQADEHENDGVARMVKIVAKDGHDEALLTAIEDYHKWIANFEGHMRYYWYEVLTGPNTGIYYARSGGHNWADFDAKYDWQKEAGEVFERNVMPHIDSMEIAMSVDMDEVSHWPENWDGYTLFTVESWYIHNGQYGKFNRGLKRIVDTLKANGFPKHFGFSSVATGGHTNQVSLVMPSKGWAGMADEKPTFAEIMMKELGGEDEFDAFMADWGTTFKAGHIETVKILPDASDYGTD